MSDSLKSQTLGALFWSFIESAGLQGVRFVIGIVLARMLLPQQFGLIGMLTIFMAVAQTFLDSGFGAALIQKQDATQTDSCSIFYFNIAVGLAAAGLLYAAAPWIASFYNEPILTPITRALSLTIVINSFGLVQNAILTKQIKFKTLTKVSLIANVLSGIVGVTMAAYGFGVWSLVIQQISSALLATICLWFFCAWRPSLVFSFKSLRKMFVFGSRLLASGLLNQIFENIYLVVIGKIFSAKDLGFFSRAQTMGSLPANTLAGMVSRVTFPVFSTIQNNPTQLKSGLKKALTSLAFVNFPMMIGLALIARPLVLVLLTEKWVESIYYLQLICLLGLLYPLHVINLNLLQALARSDLFLRLEIIKKAMVVINIAVTWRWGIAAMIYGMIVMSAISYYLNSYYTGVLIGYSFREQLRDLAPYLIMAVLMGFAVYPAGLLPIQSPLFMVMVQILIGIITYACLCKLFKLTVFTEVWRAGLNKIKNSRSSVTT